MTVYLDHNATTPVRPEAAEAVAAALATTGNPSSIHGAGRAARRLVEDARERVAALVGALAAIGGLAASWEWDTPAGPSVVLCAAAILAAANVAAALKRVTPMPSSPSTRVTASARPLLWDSPRRSCSACRNSTSSRV